MDSSHPLEVKNFTSAFILLGVGMVCFIFSTELDRIIYLCFREDGWNLKKFVFCIVLFMIHLSSVLTGYRNCSALHGALLLPLFTASVAALGSNGTLWFNFNEYGTFTKLSQVASALCLIFLFLHILFPPAYL